MATALITGSYGGLGSCFVKLHASAGGDLILVGRGQKKLDEQKAQVEKEYGVKVYTIEADLSKAEDVEKVYNTCKENGWQVDYLINNAGLGELDNIADSTWPVQSRMVDLNCRALTAVTTVVLPHMERGGFIVNVCSIASFCPNTRMTVYSSTKAYVTSFTVGLSEELKPKGITVTAVCPGPMETEFIHLGGIKGQSKTFDILPYCDQVRVAGGALRATRAGKTIYTPTLFYKFYRVLAKVTPVKLMVKFTKT